MRIEDIDHQRCRSEYEAAIYQDLAWLGLAWETPVRRQSDHMGDYEAALETLRDKGLLYRCFRTRKEVEDDIARAPHGPVETFTGESLPAAEEAARLAAGAPYAWRLSLKAARHLGAEAPDAIGDVVLARKDVGVAYHLACVVDDALQGVTHVIRGEDLIDAIPVQRLLQDLLGLPAPTYAHHPLVLGPDGKRLAKRNGGEPLRDLRARGVTIDELRAQLDAAPKTNEVP